MREGENPDDIRIILCAYMGFAAFNISGQTICTAFHKKIFKSIDVLSADELNTFRMKYRHLKVVIIDEISMVDNTLLNFINTRLQQLTGTKKEFGGVSVIAVGDLYQLPPIIDSRIIFADLEEGASSLAQNLWKDLFKMYELVEIMRQKDDLEFAQLLNRLRVNEMTEDDMSKLKTRLFDRNADDYPKDALHLFAENAGVNEHNDKVLNTMPVEKVLIPCYDTVVSANLSARKCEELIQKLPNDFSKTGQLLKVLTVAVGMIYVMTVNVDVEDGLTNGSPGIVKYIEYRMLEQTNRPSIIWVLFDDPRAGRLRREKFLNRGYYNVNIQRDWTPVFDVERTFLYNHKTYQRIQFPLRPAAARTVHKAQGATVDKVVVDLSTKRKRSVPHIHYVAFSRVRKLEDLYILDFNEHALELDERVPKEMNRLQTEAPVELCYVPIYKINPAKIKIAFNNARSLYKHFKDIEREPNVLSADVIGFAETRLCTRDESQNLSLKRFRLIRLDEMSESTANRPYHGLALYIKDYLHVQKVLKQHCQSCEFIQTTLSSSKKKLVQVVILYKYPKSTLPQFRNDIQNHLRPVVDLSMNLVILGDFNVQIQNDTSFVDFVESLFDCVQQIQQPTCDTGSTLDLLFTNSVVFCDVLEAYWTDHRLIYCALES